MTVPGSEADNVAEMFGGREGRGEAEPVTCQAASPAPNTSCCTSL